MKEYIIAQIKPTNLEHIVYIITNETEIVPLVEKCTKDNLLSVITMSAAKYKINTIKLQGPKDYTGGVKEQLQKKINTCFGANSEIVIELI